jgi:hypothetical protein
LNVILKDEQTANQYERFKNQLTKELYGLLAAYDISTPVAVAA